MTTQFYTRFGSEIPPTDVVSTKSRSCTYKFMDHCGRCGGLGGSEAWKFTGWTCYKCGGMGLWADTATGYTADKLAELNAAVEKATAKREAKAAAKELAAQSAQTARLTTYFGDRVEELSEVAKINGFIYDIMEKARRFDLTQKQIDAVMAAADRIKVSVAKDATSTFVGNVGVRMQLTAKLVKRIPIDSAYGRTYLHILETQEGNSIKGFTTNRVLFDIDEGETVTFFADISAHEVRADRKETAFKVSRSQK